MDYFQLAMEALQAAAATADAAAKAKVVAEKFKEQAQRTMELTPEQSAALDAKSLEVFGAAKEHISGR